MRVTLRVRSLLLLLRLQAVTCVLPQLLLPPTTSWQQRLQPTPRKRRRIVDAAHHAWAEVQLRLLAALLVVEPRTSTRASDSADQSRCVGGTWCCCWATHHPRLVFLDAAPITPCRVGSALQLPPRESCGVRSVWWIPRASVSEEVVVVGWTWAQQPRERVRPLSSAA
jgi:hypothetical protein